MIEVLNTLWILVAPALLEAWTILTGLLMYSGIMLVAFIASWVIHMLLPRTPAWGWDERAWGYNEDSAD
jgi:hypothetical protein